MRLMSEPLEMPYRILVTMVENRRLISAYSSGGFWFVLLVRFESGIGDIIRRYTGTILRDYRIFADIDWEQ